jgi:hypothetical protein
MKWYNYLACFFLGVFFVNSLPHFIHGISGDYLPTPFANPPGKGLSSPIINLIWGYCNIIISLLLFKGSKITFKDKWAIILFIIGFVMMSIGMSLSFAIKG